MLTFIPFCKHTDHDILFEFLPQLRYINLQFGRHVQDYYCCKDVAKFMQDHV